MSWKTQPLRGVSHFKCCAACSSRYCPIAPEREKQNREILVAASDNPALRSGVGELPAVTTKPTAIRMLVCHGGVSLFGCELYFLPPCEARIIYFGSLRVSFPPLFKASLPLLPVSPTPSVFLSGQDLCNEIPCLRTMAFAKVTCTVWWRCLLLY